MAWMRWRVRAPFAPPFEKNNFDTLCIEVFSFLGVILSILDRFSLLKVIFKKKWFIENVSF